MPLSGSCSVLMVVCLLMIGFPEGGPVSLRPAGAKRHEFLPPCGVLPLQSTLGGHRSVEGKIGLTCQRFSTTFDPSNFAAATRRST